MNGKIENKKVIPLPAYMPVCLNIYGKECLVVGGGSVALRKITVLRKFGGRVTCISPAFIKPLERMGSMKKIKCIRQAYPRAISLKRYALVVAATDNPLVNKRVAADGLRDKTLVNVVDKSAAGSIIMPAILKRKGLLLGVSTAGRSPGLAKKMRDILSHAL